MREKLLDCFRDSITRSLKATEYIRSKAKVQLDEEFRSNRQSLENRKKIVLKKLSTFGMTELKQCQLDSKKVEDCILKAGFRHR